MAIGDIYYNDVSLLLHCDGTDGSTSFPDNSSTVHTVTANGTAEVDTSQSKFGGASALFNGSTSYLSAPNSTEFALETASNFTVECWVRPNTLGDHQVLVANRYDASGTLFGWNLHLIPTGEIVFYFTDGVVITTVAQLSVGVWSHVAVVRSAGTVTIYIDGISSVFQLFPDGVPSTSRLIIGANHNGTSNFFGGNIDELRITIDVARYTANFTPETVAFPNFAPAYINIGTDFELFSLGDLSIPTDFKLFNLGSLSVGTQFELLDAFRISTEFKLFSTGNLSFGTDFSLFGIVSIGTDFQIELNEGTLTVMPAFKIFRLGSMSVGVENELFDNSGLLSVAVENKLSNSGTININTKFDIFTLSTSNSRQVNASILIDGSNVTSRVAGSIRVNGNEGVARLANFSILPNSGLIDPYDWIGKSVTIDFIEDGVSTRIFTGIVHVPKFNVTTGIVDFSCTDSLQETVELLDEQNIETVVGGFWDDNIFSGFKDGWTYAQERLSTLPASYDLDVYRFGRVTNWEPKNTADFAFTSSNVIHDSESLQLAERRNIVNSIKLDFSARFNKKWQKQYKGRWNIPHTFPIWLGDPYGLPTSEMIEDSIDGEVIESISFGILPAASGNYHVDSSLDIIGWIATDYTRTLATSVFFKTSRRWLQTVSKDHTIIVKSDASILKHGELQIERKISANVENGENWEEYEDYASPTGTLVGAEKTVDVSDVDYSNAMDTALNIAKTELLSSHRKNRVDFDVSLNPNIDLNHTVSVTLDNLTAKGKVSSISHVIDLGSGRSVSTITISMYRPNISSQVNDLLGVDLDIEIDGSNEGNDIALDTHIGNVSDQYSNLYEPDDEDWRGWTTNYDEKFYQGTPVSNVPPLEAYNERWGIDIPEVLDVDRDALEQTQEDSINVAIPQDLLTITG